MSENLNKNNIKEDKETSKYGNLLLFYVVFKKYRKIILPFSIIISIIVAILVFLVMDPIFKSQATLKTTTKESGLSGLMGMTGLPGIGDLSEMGGGTMLKELTVYENILLSRKCVEETILHFNLNAEWEFKFFEDAVKFFREGVLEIKKDKIAGTLDIAIYDKNPVRAKEIVEFLVNRLNSIYTELNVQNARNNRQFIESRYQITVSDLSKIEDSLKNYQDKFGVAPDIQVQAAVKTELELEAMLKSEEIKLDLLNKMFTPDQPEIKQQQEKISSLRKQISEIQNKTQQESKLNIKGMPDVILNYLRIKRDVEIQNKILTTLIPLLEQAKIEENRNTPTVLVLDPPVVPEKKVKPKRLTLTALSFVGSFIFSFLFFIAFTKWKEFYLIAKENKIHSSNNV